MDLIIIIISAITIIVLVILSIPTEVYREIFPFFIYTDGCEVSVAKLMKIRLFNFYYISHEYAHIKLHPKTQFRYKKFLKQCEIIKLK
jgi:hypothetical protein